MSPTSLEGGTLSLATAFIALFSCSSVPAVDRHHVPDDTVLREVTTEINRVFDDKLAKARTADERSAIAREIHAAVASTKDTVERYALLRAALDTASTGNDPGLTCEIAAGMAMEYQVDEIQLLGKWLKGHSGPIAIKSWLSAASRLRDAIQDGLDRGRYEEASDLITIYAMLARRAGDATAVNATAEFRKALAAKRKADRTVEELTIAAAGTNASPAAVDELGRLLCFDRDDWERGLPYLARSSEKEIASCAATDLAAASVEQKLAVAEAWERAAATVSPLASDSCYRRALALYQSLLPGLSGVSHIKVENAIERVLEARAKSGRGGEGWIVVFRSIDPAKWNTDSRHEPLDYALPLATLPETVRFVRLRRLHGAAVILSITKDELGGETKGPVFGWQGARRDYWNAVPLGAFDTRQNVAGMAGRVAVFHSGEQSFSGWGFGHRIVAKRDGERAQLCWGGELIPLEPLEISVTSRALSSAERRLLLR